MDKIDLLFYGGMTIAITGLALAVFFNINYFISKFDPTAGAITMILVGFIIMGIVVSEKGRQNNL